MLRAPSLTREALFPIGKGNYHSKCHPKTATPCMGLSLSHLQIPLCPSAGLGSGNGARILDTQQISCAGKSGRWNHNPQSRPLPACSLSLTTAALSAEIRFKTPSLLGSWVISNMSEIRRKITCHTRKFSAWLRKTVLKSRCTRG